jgi:hypothetical protein
MKKVALKGLSYSLAAVVAWSPLVVAPQHTYALSVEDVSADDTDPDEETEYTIEFEIDKDLKAGDTITVKFPTGYSVDKKLKHSDVILEDEDGDDISIDKVSVSGNTVTVTLDESVKKDQTLTLYIDNITNPDDDGEYSISVKTSKETSYKSGDIRIGDKKSSSGTRYGVTQSSYEAGSVTSIALAKFNLERSVKLKKGKYLYVQFPTKDMLPDSVDRTDVTVNGSKADRVTVLNKDTLRITIPSGADGDSYVRLEFSANADIKNPNADGQKYTYVVEYENKKYESDYVQIVSSKREPFDVTLTDKHAGARSGYTFDLSLNRKLDYNTTIEVEFPAAFSVPPTFLPGDVQVNGKDAVGIYANGSKVSFKTPSSFTSTSRVNITFDYRAFIANPNTPGSYQVKVTIQNQTYQSKPFEISGAAPVPVNNSTATVTTTKTTPNTSTGIQVNLKGVGVPLEKGRDFFELVLPAGFRLPAAVNAYSVSVNGLTPSYVGVRGQNLIVIPAQDIPANTPVSLVIQEAAGVVTPAVSGIYSIGVYTSEEMGLLFARPVSIAQSNAVMFKANTASFTKLGKTYPLAVAPFTVQGHTLMPVSFFRDGLGLHVTWDKSVARIVSGGTTIQFRVGSNTATVNGKTYTLPTQVQLRNNMPLIPLRFVCDTLQYKILYHAGNYTITK